MRFTPKQARLISGKTQQEVADYIKVERHTIGVWEREPHRFQIKNAKLFAEAVSLPVEKIAFWDTVRAD